MIAPHSTDLRAEFPQLAASDAVYMDSAATSLKPRCVIDSLAGHLGAHVANVHRGSYERAIAATEAFEEARATIARAVGACSNEIAFTANASTGLHLVAALLRQTRRRAFVTRFEHHSNLLPWKQNFETSIIPCNEFGAIDLDAVRALPIGPDSVVSVAHASNVTGVVQPVAELAALCRRAGAALVVDGAQSFPHLPIDVEELGCEFFVFSGHKALGPSGVGVVYGARRRWADAEPPWLGGGTLDKYSLERGYSTRNAPHCFELGTPNVEGVLATATAVEFLGSLDRAAVARSADALYRRMACRLDACGRYRVLGGTSADAYISVVTIAVDGVSAEMFASLLWDRYRICARGGYHCAHPLYTGLGLSGGVRLSAYIYNTERECDYVVEALEQLGGERVPRCS